MTTVFCNEMLMLIRNKKAFGQCFSFFSLFILPSFGGRLREGSGYQIELIFGKVPKRGPIQKSILQILVT